MWERGLLGVLSQPPWDVIGHPSPLALSWILVCPRNYYFELYPCNITNKLFNTYGSYMLSSLFWELFQLLWTIRQVTLQWFNIHIHQTCPLNTASTFILGSKGVSLNNITAHFLNLYIIPLICIFYEDVSLFHSSYSIVLSIPEINQPFKGLIFSFPTGYHLMNQNDQFSLPVDLYCITRHHKQAL